MKAKVKVLLMVFVAIISVALYGCSGDKNNQDNEQTPAADEAPGTPTYGGTVVVGILQDLDSLDPHKAVAAGTKEVLFNVFEGLVKPDESGELIPAVASDYSVSEDGKVYTFTLRDNVKFHNGETVTVGDVVYSLNRYVTLNLAAEPVLSNIIEIKEVDDKTIEISLEETDTELIGYLTIGIIPEAYDEADTKPVGTGPFKFLSYTPMESLKVVKNEDYYLENTPYLDEVIFKVITNADSVIMDLLSGSIDILAYLTSNQAEQLKDDFSIEEGNMNLVQGLFLNNDVEPFNKKEVRQALYHGIDRQGVLDMVADGKGEIIGSNMFPGFTKYYNGDLASLYDYDPQKAKSLLNDAGYPDGFTFTITVPSNYPYHVDTAQVIVEQLKQIGVDATIKQVEWATWLSDVYSSRDYESTIIGLDAKLAPRNVLERYQSSASGNFVNYDNENFDKVFEKAIRTTDDSEKVAFYMELQEILAEDAASIYLQDPSLLVAVNKELGGYTFYPVYVQDMSKVYYKE
ncbi:MAG: ABC transporter substrate-binding protein [Clostridiales bacterium]|nr:ABC transporter substrate-binding protein [Clostridiales bacterium]